MHMVRIVLLLNLIFSAALFAKTSDKKKMEICRVTSKDLLLHQSYSARTNIQNPVLEDVTFNFSPANRLLIRDGEKCVVKGRCQICKSKIGAQGEVLIETPFHVERALSSAVAECRHEARVKGLVEEALEEHMESCPPRQLKFVNEERGVYIQCDPESVEKEMAEAFDFSTTCNAAKVQTVRNPKAPAEPDDGNIR